MKRCVIVHCWEGYPKYCWYPWVKRELEKKGFKVMVPAMPDSVNPKLSGWLPKLKKVIGKSDDKLYLVGHSLGCITIMRYLEGLKKEEKIAGVVMVAGFVDNLGYKEIASFFEKPVNFKKIKSHAGKFVAIHSDNDPYVALTNADVFKKELGAKVVVMKDMNHFSGEIENEEACTKLPQVVENITK